MKKQNSKHYELTRLLVEFMEDGIDRERFDELQEQLLKDTSAFQYTVEFMSMWALLDQEDITNAIDGAGSLYGSELWTALAEQERTAESIKVIRELDENDSTGEALYENPVPNIRSRRVSRLAVSFLIGSIAALIFIFVFIRLYPLKPPPLVAKLKGSLDAEWLQMSAPIVDKEDMRAGFYELGKGCVEIVFDDGGEVIIEGPSRVTLESRKSIFLESGRLSIYVPERATGFTVNTPGSTIVDLGTEFGVSVKSDGTSEVFMFQGKASLIAGRSGEAKDSRMITFGQALQVDGATSVVREIEAGNSKFARKLDSKTKFVWRGEGINLADIIGGGNGFGTGRLNTGIDPISGRFVGKLDYSEVRFGNGKYVAIPELQYIDGVFVPDSGTGTVQIDSEGHIFTDCPDTDGRYWTQITNGSMVGLTVGAKSLISLEGTTYGTAERPAILMVPNVGITFDLRAIRSSMPGVDILMFSAIYGLSSNFGDIPAESYPKADFTVFVDGEKRFADFAVTAMSGLKQIQVAISESDNYLTLVATDGGDTNGQDWLICGVPVLELKRTGR